MFFFCLSFHVFHLIPFLFSSCLSQREYVTKDVFNKNFMADWRSVMTPKERELITDLKKCDFTKMKVRSLVNVLVAINRLMGSGTLAAPRNKYQRWVVPFAVLTGLLR